MSRVRPTPTTRDLAQQLLNYAAATSQDDVPSVVRVSEKLRRVLGVLVGNNGFRSLLARSLTLAKAQEPVLSNVKVTSVLTSGNRSIAWSIP